MKGVHLDHRWSPIINNSRVKPQIIDYLVPGVGFGGSCFPKDVKAISALAKEKGINRFILMSANGAKMNGTSYQSTKYISEEYLKFSDLDYTIFRPSLIFGDPRGNDRPEFCTQLKKDMLNLPFPAPNFFKVS